MGWPLALSVGLMERSSRALAAALWPLTVGHLLAILLVILPFALLVALVERQRPIRIGASLVVLGFGIFRLINRRHPRALARIPPGQLGLWSFAVAIAHGAGLMLVPIYLGLCRTTGLERWKYSSTLFYRGFLLTKPRSQSIHTRARTTYSPSYAPDCGATPLGCRRLGAL